MSTVQQAAQLALEHYGINASVKPLAGEEDYNFYLKARDGQEYTLKISRTGTDRSIIDLQIAITEHLAQSAFPLQLPEIVPASSGEALVELADQQFVRLQKWVSGRMLAEANPRSEHLFQSWGESCGLLSRHLQGFDHHAAHRYYKWNPSNVLDTKKYRPYFKDFEALSIADYFWDLFEKRALPQLPQLRKSVNYNDAHEHNLLVNYNYAQPEVSGVIDFGDTLYTETINELAIASAYASMYVPDPLQACVQVVRAYHAVFPLQEEEIAVLFPLIAARLLTTVAHAAWNKHNEPDNEYLVISERPAWDALKKWHALSPAFVYYTFRQACGLIPCPSFSVFKDWMVKHQNDLHPILDFDNREIIALDLSVGSLDLGNNSNFDDSRRFHKTIDRLLETDQGEAIGMGGYLEVRPFYTTDAYQMEGNKGVQWRTVHLGVDAWDKAGTPLYAPLDGVVYSFQDNAGERNYGPTLILKHEPQKGLIFYTLYGHLSRKGLSKLQEGDHIEKGQHIATIGPAPENGNWPPHLHFQIILDMLGNKGDFPGVAYPHEQAVWSSLCPNPKHFFPTFENASEVKTAEEILQIRHHNLGKSLSLSYQKPLHIQRAYKQYLYDHTGRRYLDTVNNVPHVGHQHPRVVRAAQRQMEVLNTNTRYLHQNIVLFAEELLATLPEALSVVHFVNSGSEANELAFRMATAYTNQTDLIAVEVGYHGNTAACIAASSYKFDGKGGKGAPPTTHIVPLPDTFRGLYRDPQTAGKAYARHVGEAIKKIREEGRNISGFICESILSCGGQIVLPEDYLKEAYGYIRAAGGLCIADEVQVGFGRVGDYFWGFELQGVVPDILTLGKPIGNGHPLGAVVCTQEVAEAFANGMEYFNTFGGNPVSCAIGREVLQVIQEEALQQNAKTTGDYLLKGLRDLQKDYPIIGDVRGHGLFLGFELMKESGQPAAKAASSLANRMKERGILMSTDGPDYNVLKIKPPMCFNEGNADFLLENLDRVLGEDYLRGERVVDLRYTDSSS
jgi:4-aminobutyrate aminotransferase-like enzyme/Ser/Thr protein kinase RdoA (MazF antagonist)